MYFKWGGIYFEQIFIFYIREAARCKWGHANQTCILEPYAKEIWMKHDYMQEGGLESCGKDENQDTPHGVGI